MTFPLMGHLAMASNLVPAFVGVVKFKQLPTALRVLVVLCLLACAQGLAEYVVPIFLQNNYFLSDYYRILEVSLLCAVFVLSTSNAIVRKVLGVLGGTFASLWLVDTLMFSDSSRINNVMAILARAFLVLMSAATLWALIREEDQLIVERPAFWLVVGVTLYSTGTIVVLGLSNYLLHLGQPYFLAAWYLNWCLVIAMNIFYTKGLVCRVTV